MMLALSSVACSVAVTPKQGLQLRAISSAFDLVPSTASVRYWYSVVRKFAPV